MKLKSYIVHVNSRLGFLETMEHEIDAILQQNGFELVSFEMNNDFAIIIGRVNEGQNA